MVFFLPKFEELSCSKYFDINARMTFVSFVLNYIHIYCAIFILGKEGYKFEVKQANSAHKQFLSTVFEFYSTIEVLVDFWERMKCPSSGIKKIGNFFYFVYVQTKFALTSPIFQYYFVVEENVLPSHDFKVGL